MLIMVGITQSHALHFLKTKGPRTEKEGKMNIYQMNDCDWYAAETLDEAKLCMAKMVANGEVTPAFEKEFLDNPRWIDDAEMDSLKFCEEYDERTDYANELDYRRKVSFREKLRQMIDAGEKFPTFFASTEY